MSHACVFCGLVDKKLPVVVVHEDEHNLAFMDIFPLRPGHVLVIPKRHAQHVHELTTEERTRLFELGNRIAVAMRQSKLGLDDLHLNINDGPAANQSVPHVHLHLLPRYRGDGLSFIKDLLKKPLQLARAPWLGRPAEQAQLQAQAAAIRAQLLP